MIEDLSNVEEYWAMVRVPRKKKEEPAPQKKKGSGIAGIDLSVITWNRASLGGPPIPYPRYEREPEFYPEYTRLLRIAQDFLNSNPYQGRHPSPIAQVSRIHPVLILGAVTEMGHEYQLHGTYYPPSRSDPLRLTRVLSVQELMDSNFGVLAYAVEHTISDLLHRVATDITGEIMTGITHRG